MRYGEHQVLKGIDRSVDAGEILGFFGPNDRTDGSPDEDHDRGADSGSTFGATSSVRL
jgi:hypothetical protein